MAKSAAESATAGPAGVPPRDAPAPGRRLDGRGGGHSDSGHLPRPARGAAADARGHGRSAGRGRRRVPRRAHRPHQPPPPPRPALRRDLPGVSPPGPGRGRARGRRRVLRPSTRGSAGPRPIACCAPWPGACRTACARATRPPGSRRTPSSSSCRACTTARTRPASARRCCAPCASRSPSPTAPYPSPPASGSRSSRRTARTRRPSSPRPSSPRCARTRRAATGSSRAPRRPSRTASTPSSSRRACGPPSAAAAWRSTARPRRPASCTTSRSTPSATRRIVGVEALLRWQHPQMGLVFPQSFLSRSDFTGPHPRDRALDPPHGGRAGPRVAAEPARDSAIGRQPLPARAHEEDPAGRREGGPRGDGPSPPASCSSRCPEGHVVSDLPRSVDMLHRLKALGVQLVLDRFAVRYSSLGRLAELPLDGVKLDLAFLRGPSSNPEDVSLLTAVTAVARGLKLRVCAQGVETAAQLALLERLGCAEAQGFHLGPPVPPATLADQLGARAGEAGDAGAAMSFGGRLETLELSALLQTLAGRRRERAAHPHAPRRARRPRAARRHASSTPRAAPPAETLAGRLLRERLVGEADLHAGPRAAARRDRLPAARRRARRDGPARRGHAPGGRAPPHGGAGGRAPGLEDGLLPLRAVGRARDAEVEVDLGDFVLPGRRSSPGAPDAGGGGARPRATSRGSRRRETQPALPPAGRRAGHVPPHRVLPRRLHGRGRALSAALRLPDRSAAPWSSPWRATPPAAWASSECASPAAAPGPRRCARPSSPCASPRSSAPRSKGGGATAGPLEPTRVNLALVERLGGGQVREAVAVPLVVGAGPLRALRRQRALRTAARPARRRSSPRRRGSPASSRRRSPPARRLGQRESPDERRSSAGAPSVVANRREPGIQSVA